MAVEEFTGNAARRGLLEAAILELETTAAAFIDAADGDDKRGSGGAGCPAWVWVLDAHAKRIRAAYEAGGAS